MMSESTDKQVLRASTAALERYRAEDAVIDEVSLGPLDAALAAYYVIATSEASSNLARYDGLKFGFRVKDSSRSWREVVMENRAVGFGDEVKRRILLGTYALSEGYFDMYYVRAQRIRGMLVERFKKLFRNHDVLLGPTMPMRPFRIGEKVTDPLQLFLCDVNTVPANLAGIPAISVPYPPSNSMGIGVQLMAPAFQENTLIAAATILEH
jgi:aspartyl-tRNA(Asn)/glutamyl-tRNA(Gln) amidotransferase subunit A